MLRIGVVDRTVDINGMRLHVKAGPCRGVFQPKTEGALIGRQLGKNQVLACITNHFGNFGIF